MILLIFGLKVKEKVIENSEGRDYSNLEAVYYKHKTIPEGELNYINVI